MDIETALKKGQLILKDSKIKSAELDSEILMSQAIRKDKKYIILNYNKKIKKKDLKYFDFLIQERVKKKPIAYLTKKKDFWKYEFFIDKNVLIPRPDTEVLVEQILELTKNKASMRILEIGVGSGCIILSILKEKKKFFGIGIDISTQSLKISEINSHKLGVNRRLKLFKSNIDNFNTGKYDLIISNPPYINQYDLKYLEKDVLNFEPKLALNGGQDGLSEIRKVIKKSSDLIKIKGKLILEIGFDQKESVKRLLTKKGFYINKTIKDLAMNDRCIICTKI